MPKATISVSLPTHQLAELDAMVENSDYDDRSEAVSEAVSDLLEDRTSPSDEGAAQSDGRSRRP